MCFSGASLWCLCLASTPKWAHGDSQGVAEYPELLSWLQHWLSPMPASAVTLLWWLPCCGMFRRCPCSPRCQRQVLAQHSQVQPCCVAPCLRPHGLPLLPKPQVFCSLCPRYFHTGAMALVKVSSITVLNGSCWATAPAFALARRKK